MPPSPAEFHQHKDKYPARAPALHDIDLVADSNRDSGLQFVDPFVTQSATHVPAFADVAADITTDRSRYHGAQNTRAEGR